MSFKEFLFEYYIWIVAVIIVLVIGVIGFIVDSKQSNSNSNNKSKKNKTLNEDTASGESKVNGVSSAGESLADMLDSSFIAAPIIENSNDKDVGAQRNVEEISAGFKESVGNETSIVNIPSNSDLIGRTETLQAQVVPEEMVPVTNAMVSNSLDTMNSQGQNMSLNNVVPTGTPVQVTNFQNQGEMVSPQVMSGQMASINNAGGIGVTGIMNNQIQTMPVSNVVPVVATVSSGTSQSQIGVMPQTGMVSQGISTNNVGNQVQNITGNNVVPVVTPVQGAGFQSQVGVVQPQVMSEPVAAPINNVVNVPGQQVGVYQGSNVPVNGFSQVTSNKQENTLQNQDMSGMYFQGAGYQNQVHVMSGQVNPVNNVSRVLGQGVNNYQNQGETFNNGIASPIQNNTTEQGIVTNNGGGVQPTNSAVVTTSDGAKPFNISDMFANNV